MIAGILSRLADLVDHVRGRGQVGISHSKVDDVVTSAATRTGQLGYLGKDVGRQAIELVEVVSKFLGHLTRPVARSGSPSVIGRLKADRAGILEFWLEFGLEPLRSIDRPLFLASR
jgi:hypothetical protein